VNGWEAFTVWGWVALTTILAAVYLVYVQSTRRAPALPATISLLVAVKLGREPG
jgi:hypothetical protein